MLPLIMTLLLLAPDPAAVKVPELAVLLKQDKAKEALVLLKEIGAMKKNHAEAKALVKLIRNPRSGMTDEVREASFLALKEIGSRKATRGLQGLLKHSRLKKIAAIRIGVCRAFEGSADPKARENILDMLRDKEDAVIAAAAQAAGAYRYDKEAARKDLFKTIMGIYVGTWNMKNSVKAELKTEKRRAEAKWEVVHAAMERALQLLSNVVQNDPPAWRHWWNKNKHTRWAELEH